VHAQAGAPPALIVRHTVPAMPDAVEVIMAVNAAFNRLDVDGMLAHYAPDVVWCDHRHVSFGNLEGTDQLRALYASITGSASEFTETVEVLASTPEVVVAACEVAARLTDDPTGRIVGAEYGYVATVRDGLVTRLELFDDGEGALEASGLSV
jgi:ketosteroid isomerase-like protein